MAEQSIDALRTAFDEWRLTKRHRTEPIPEHLLKHARELIPVLGLGAVAVRLGISSSRLRETSKVAQKPTQVQTDLKSVSFSRLEMARPAPSLAEVVMPNGVKLNIFSIIPETMALITALSGMADL
jgi:hypothetical protein